jgi:hypothetical protein
LTIAACWWPGANSARRYGISAPTASLPWQPPATAPGGGEIAFSVGDAATVHTLHDAWRDKGLQVVQPPTDMDFGHTFVALDPDGHRLRVFAAA